MTHPLLYPQYLIREQDPLKQGLKPYFFKKLFLFFSYSWARSIKTRIETFWLIFVMACASAHHIREQDPLKQGLKHKIILLCQSCKYSRARSIKTRIETDSHHIWRCFTWYSRARSIKTRIETKKLRSC